MREETAFACEAAREAGALIKELFGKVKGRDKGGRQLVSEADLRAERLLLAGIRRRFPDHGIVSEEDNPEHRPSQEAFWVIDPLDGTHNFLFGLPFFNVCLGLLDPRGVRCCAVYDPLRDQLFWAERGKGAFRDRQRLQVSSRGRLEEASLCLSTFSWRDTMERTPVAFAARFQEAHALGSCALTLAYLAQGTFDCKVIPRPFWFEFPSLLLAEEAGGKATDLAGGKARPWGTGTMITNGKLHAAALRAWRESAGREK